MANWQIQGAMRPTGEMKDLLDPGPSRTQTTVVTLFDAAARRAESAGLARTLISGAAAEASIEHKDRYMVMFRIRGSEYVGRGAENLLNELSSWGFAWRDVARMVGVSVPAIQKWRKGDRPSPENARRLADIVAACEIISRFNPLITDIAMWFEAPVVTGVPVTAVDLWASGNEQLVFEHARINGDVDPHETLDSYDVEWRKNYASAFEVFRAEDGELSLRKRDS